MLTVSPTAADAIRQLTESGDAPASAGVRIAAGGPAEDGSTLSLALVNAPEPDDEVVAPDGATQVYLEPQIVPFLEDAVLEAQVSEAGVAFSLRESAQA
jgi:iron-sulfur cluster assembly protein